MASSTPTYHPKATGQAAQLVAAHQEPADIVLWAGWFCPFTQRTWIVLEEKGIPYQYREVNPYLKEKAFLAVSPKGLTPGFQVHGKPLHDSSVINEYLEDAFPDPGPRLLPGDPYLKAQCRLAIDHINKAVVPSFVRLLQAQPREQSKREQASQELTSSLRTLAGQKLPGEYFLGDQFSLVDIAVVPWVVRDFILHAFRGFKRADVGKEWEKWAHALETRPSVVKTLSDPERYVEFNGTFLRNEGHSMVGRAAQQHQVMQ